MLRNPSTLAGAYMNSNNPGQPPRNGGNGPQPNQPTGNTQGQQPPFTGTRPQPGGNTQWFQVTSQGPRPISQPNTGNWQPPAPQPSAPQQHPQQGMPPGPPVQQVPQPAPPQAQAQQNPQPTQQGSQQVPQPQQGQQPAQGIPPQGFSGMVAKVFGPPPNIAPNGVPYHHWDYELLKQQKKFLVYGIASFFLCCGVFGAGSLVLVIWGVSLIKKFGKAQWLSASPATWIMLVANVLLTLWWLKTYWPALLLQFNGGYVS